MKSASGKIGENIIFLKSDMKEILVWIVWNRYLGYIHKNGDAIVDRIIELAISYIF